MAKQITTTRVQFESDFAITAAIMNLTIADRVKVASMLTGKPLAEFSHLDNGRQAMTSANLLRGLGRKDPDVVAKVKAAVEELRAAYPEGFDPLAKPKKAKAKVKVAKINYPMNWPKSKRFQFAREVDGQWQFSYTRKTEGDLTRPEGI